MKRKLLESFTGILQNLARRLVVRADLVRVARACLREKTCAVRAYAPNLQICLYVGVGVVVISTGGWD